MRVARRGPCVGDARSGCRLPQRVRGLVEDRAHVTSTRRVTPDRRVRAGRCGAAAGQEQRRVATAAARPRSRAGAAARPDARPRPAARAAGAAGWGRSGQDLHAGVLVVAQPGSGGEQRAQRVVRRGRCSSGSQSGAAGSSCPPTAAGDRAAGSAARRLVDGAGGARPRAADRRPRPRRRDGAGHPERDRQLPAGPPRTATPRAGSRRAAGDAAMGSRVPARFAHSACAPAGCRPRAVARW